MDPDGNQTSFLEIRVQVVQVVLPQAVRDKLEREPQLFLEFDPYVAKDGHKYFVRSLYYATAR